MSNIAEIGLFLRMATENEAAIAWNDVTVAGTRRVL
jgi:hypothetical protein